MENFWMNNDGNVENLVIGQRVAIDENNFDSWTFSFSVTVKPHPEGKSVACRLKHVPS